MDSALSGPEILLPAVNEAEERKAAATTLRAGRPEDRQIDRQATAHEPESATQERGAAGNDVVLSHQRNAWRSARLAPEQYRRTGSHLSIGKAVPQPRGKAVVAIPPCAHAVQHAGTITVGVVVEQAGYRDIQCADRGVECLPVHDPHFG